IFTVYSVLEQERGLYVTSEKRSDIQQNSRIGMEMMERELRMTALGVPKSANGALDWNPGILASSAVNAIYIRAEVDAKNTIPTDNVVAGATTINVDSAKPFSSATAGTP